MTTFRMPAAGAPRLEYEPVKIARTVRAGTGSALVTSANDSCLRSPGQTLSWGPLREGRFSLFLMPDTPSLYWRLSLGVGWDDQPPAADYCTVEVKLYDFSGNSYACAAPIDGAVNHYIPAASTRLESVLHVSEYISKAAAVAAGLVLTDPWRVEITVTRSGTTAMLTYCSLEELPRFLVDDAESFGVIPGTVLPRQPVRDEDQLKRLLVTLETAELKNYRTHLGLCASELGRRYTGAAPGAWAVGTTYASGDLATVGSAVYRSLQAGNLGNVPADTASDPGGAGWWATALYTTRGAATQSLLNLEEASGSPLILWTRPRSTRYTGSSRVRLIVRYRIDGDDGELVLTSGEGSYPLTLPDTAGAWTDLQLTTAYLDTGAGPGALDTMVLTGSHAGTPAAELCAITVVEYPEP